MEPFEYIATIKRQINARIKDKTGSLSDQEIFKLVKQLQTKAIGIELSCYGELKSIDPELKDYLLEGSEKEINVLKEKIRNRVLKRLKNITNFKTNQFIDDLISKKLNALIAFEINTQVEKVLPDIQKHIDNFIYKEYVSKWEAYGAMTKGILNSDS